MLFSHLSKRRRHCFSLAGPFLVSACVGFVVSSYAQEVAPPAAEATSEVDASEAQKAIEQLPDAPEVKAKSATRPTTTSTTNRALRSEVNSGRGNVAPAAQPAADTRRAIVPMSTPVSPGALVPDDGWEIRDEPLRRDGSSGAWPATPTSAPETLRTAVQRLNLPLPLPQGRVVIDKSERRLDLYNGSTLVKSYRVALGNRPSGHKAKQGDGRTPEGDFYICTRNAKTSAFHIFLGLSYPALPDAKRAVNSKQITWREYQIIHQRLASRGRPLWETNLGGWVGIHGGTDATFAQKKRRERGNPDWTAGCIALTNREIEEIHAATRLGTPVKVQP